MRMGLCCYTKFCCCNAQVKVAIGIMELKVNTIKWLFQHNLFRWGNFDNGVQSNTLNFCRQSKYIVVPKVQSRCHMIELCIDLSHIVIR